ncbi:MAG: hypothetical protein A2Y45_05825 [Tenericutes bacterium GWC2_34_14]|nr:MAG: hypothetical protein A2Z84_06505 [Tenericutes bacterium GWA2_35_7]OHE28473.1 MAG: hypothetical protein A2Y45_05825 [Tenericutes bacterium GWC2_34_14]OHE33619.1 MAG: hypothetical protein A2012_03985 [Tenericutes bacterium GWE2_34_108]OHE36904.1 MAG: hypothetical protein A2Y46_09785 [Tenericutes bacterium GWF1_35_14]OHE38016.1 MAG: hypothetical protein A2Y44_08880 [Tenericutes bacterium GWF2_35_184]OHE43467.1 MAG: hypothetical protein A2221_06855 [Tenericutes bacterium RIFOXYA2_FULL_36_3
MLKDNQMVVTNQNGDEAVCDILFTHEANGKNYVVFEFVDTHEVSAAIYVPGETDDEGEFKDIETDAEWDMLDQVLQAYYDELDAEEEDEDDDEEESDEAKA